MKPSISESEDLPGAAALTSIVKRPPLVFVSGRGSWITDQNGREYLDFIQGWAVNSLGHCHKNVVAAINRQASLLLTPSPAFYNLPAMELAQLICANSGFDEVFFTNSGAEANEGAIKLARKWGQLHRDGAHEIITMEHGFHGRTLATMSASGKPQWEHLFEPKVPGFVKVPFNDSDRLRRAVSDRTVAILLELIQGEAGVWVADEEFAATIRELSRAHDLLVIVDEVQTGAGRTGELFAHPQFDLDPDIMTLGKGIGSGVPLGAVVSKKRISCFEPGDQGGTYNGNPLVTAVGSAVIETMLEPGFLEQVRARGHYLAEALRKISGRFSLGEVRGRGLLLALDLRRDLAPRICESALEAGLLLNAPRPDTLRFMPALTVSEEEIDLCVEKIGGILETVI